MKYILIEMGAIDEIVANRFLQSTEFATGKAFAMTLQGQHTEEFLSPSLVITRKGDGLFISRVDFGDSRFIVIDVEQSRIFETLSEGDVLFITQKLLRFSKKLWQGLSLNFSERIFSGTSKAVLFTSRGYEQSPFRIAIEREPWSERLTKRGHRGKFLLAYKAGREGGDSAREEAGLTNFRRAYEALPEVRQQAKHTSERSEPSREDLGQLEVLKLNEMPAFGSNSLYRPLKEWLPLLTTQQNRFVVSPINGPYRIEGAAGTGKTLCLMLKAIATLNTAKERKEVMNLAFVTHSDATKRSILDALSVIDGTNYAQAGRSASQQTLKVCTLSELCAEELRQVVSESEFIDRDAMESKGLQLLYIGEALAQAMSSDFPSHERFLTSEFASFLKTEDSWKISEMLQHEISVIIKGRASEDIDRYRKLAPLKYGMPISSHADKGFVFTIFRLYQQRLGDFGQFDTDDVVLSAIGQLDTPIWRRRRARDGYDAILVDETHLFNMNELHVFHYFTKSEGPYPIVYSVDRSQAVGDRGWTSVEIANSLVTSEAVDLIEQVRTVFRSSPDIVNLAFSIVASGAMLFTNFDNPMDAAASGFTDAEERLSAPPRYIHVPNEEAMVETAFAHAEQLQKGLECRRSDILIVTLDDRLLNSLTDFATEKHKAHLLLKKRGDAVAVERARASGQLVVAHADYVGGLEFFAVVLVGVDRGRVPPSADELNESSKHFLSYAAHNRLYVAISRAKYRVELIGEKARGPSRLLEPAIAAGLIQISEAT